jgi:coenzyme PQQ precursor peptide PqqA
MSHLRHAACITEGGVGPQGGPTGCAHPISRSGSHRAHHFNTEGAMTWTKPEAEIVAVTMEVTAYVATL